MHFQFAQYLDLARCNRSALQHDRNRTSLSTVILTYRKWMWPFAQGAQQRCNQSRRQDNKISVRMECTRHTVLFRKYQCAPEHPSFFALTSLFPSISRCNQSHTRTDKQDGNSNDDPIFSPTHFHAITWPIPRVLSALIMMAVTGIYAPSLLLCLFILAHCLDPHHGDNKTYINQSVLGCSHTLNVHSSTPHSPSQC